MLNPKKLFFLYSLLLLWPILTTAEEPTILINEIAWMGTENSGNDEWIELYNNTENEIDLTGWKLEAADGSPEINLEGTISANSYFLLERTDDESLSDIIADQIYTGSLSNAGEYLKLYNAENNLIDEINPTDGWPGGDNSTKQTLERASQNNWQTSLESGGTPKAENSTASPEDDEPDEKEEIEDESISLPTSPSPKKGEIIITEIFPNPAGIDLDKEFIEIKNVSQKRIDITSWKITNLAKQNYLIPSINMTPESIVTFYRKKTNLALNNNKEKITLYATNNRIIDRVEYKSTAPEDKSYQKNNEGKWHWTEITPGKNLFFENLILPVAVINGPKQAQINKLITFDGSDSFDPEKRELNFSWDFNNGQIKNSISTWHAYVEPGSYEVLLTVAADEKASSTTKFKIKIIDDSDQTPTSAPETPTSTSPGILEEIPFIFISEFLPNPEGSDAEAEFIEIFSNHEKPVNLAGWQLDDAEGGSKPYTIPQGTIIKPGQYLAFFRNETKIALNNSDEAVQLLTPDSTIVDYTDYEESKEGVSFVLDEQFRWQQSETPTPGEINILDNVKEDDEEEKKKEDKKTEPKVLSAATEIIENEPKNKNKYIFSAISTVMILGAGAFLKLKGKNNH